MLKKGCFPSYQCSLELMFFGCCSENTGLYCMLSVGSRGNSWFQLNYVNFKFSDGGRFTDTFVKKFIFPFFFMFVPHFKFYLF
jgi:hypothetical protein